ncbi:MAG TPA: hypothetical protein VFH45_13185 [Acidimicrobiales bacterium]|nr:hypothetical protein [Acidimicrobiales bacterium]
MRVHLVRKRVSRNERTGVVRDPGGYRIYLPGRYLLWIQLRRPGHPASGHPAPG